MKKPILISSVSALLLLASSPVLAENICHRRAEARRHTALSQASLAHRNRVRSCQTLPSPDRAEQCIRMSRATYERDAQAARLRYSQDVRRCGTEA